MLFFSSFFACMLATQSTEMHSFFIGGSLIGLESEFSQKSNSVCTLSNRMDFFQARLSGSQAKLSGLKKNRRNKKMVTQQKTGFARFTVMALASQLGVDTHASFIGTEISDMLVASVCEQREKLYSVSMKGAKNSLLLIDGKMVYVWRVSIQGDTYERSVGAHSVRGSVALLRKVYGERNVALTNEEGAKKVLLQKKADRGTLSFYNLSHLIAKVKEAKVEKTTVKEKVKVKVKVKTKA